MKKLIVSLLTLVLVFSSSIISTTADDYIKPKSIKKIIVTDKNIKVGDDFELKAVTNPYEADDDYIRWKVVGKKGIVSIVDGDYDDELDLVALKKGKTKIRCYIAGQGKKGSKTITINVKKAPKKSKITRKGKATRIVELGDDFDLEVKKSKGLSDKYLKWTISNKNIIRFDDADITNDEVEFEAIKIGKTTVTCTNKKTKQKVKFTIKVVPDNDYDD